MGLVGMIVLACLLLLSIYSMALIFDKQRRFRAATRQSVLFLPAFGRCLSQGELTHALATAQQHDKSHVARVVSAGVTELIESGRTVSNAELRVELVSRVLDRSTAMTLAEMGKGLGGLATIGSMAPFIGLFGTVIGIIDAFSGIAQSGSASLAVVAPGIAEALIATAVGLLAAIPATIFYNVFVGRIDELRSSIDLFNEELSEDLIAMVRGSATTGLGS